MPDYVDFHADTLTEIREGDLYANRCDVDLRRTEAAFSSYVQVFALWRDLRGRPGDPAAFRTLYARARALLAAQEDRIRLCTDAWEMDRALAAGKSAAFLSLEDLEAAGGETEHLRKLGFSFILLTWNYANSYGAGAVFDQGAGLTPLGRETVRRLESQGLVLDVSHLSDAGFWDLCEQTDRPLLASHSNCRRVCRSPRNLDDDQLRELIRRGGAVGLNLYPPFLTDRGEATFASAERHLAHLLELGGQDCAVLGCDFDGCGGRFPQGVRGVEDLPRFYDYLLARGYSEALVRRLFNENGKAFLHRVLPAPAAPADA
jgi:membrane dipeptidase